MTTLSLSLTDSLGGVGGAVTDTALHIPDVVVLSTSSVAANPAASSCTAPACPVNYTSVGCEWGEGLHPWGDPSLTGKTYNSLVSRFSDGYNSACSYTHSNPTGDAQNSVRCARLCMKEPSLSTGLLRTSISGYVATPTAASCTAPACPAGYHEAGCEWGEAVHWWGDTALTGYTYSSLLSRLSDGYGNECSHTHTNPQQTYNTVACQRLCLPD